VLKFFPLFFASLRRKPIRTGLTLASIVVAFLLLGLLKTLESALALGADLAGQDRLLTMSKIAIGQRFPRSYLERISTLDGVKAAASFNWFGGSYQDDRYQVSAMSTDPDRFFSVYPEYKLPETQRADWISDRASAIVGKSLADRYGWHLGDTIPLRSGFYTKSDGTNSWTLRIAGVYESGNGDNATVFFHYDYLNESVGRLNQIGFVMVRVADPKLLQETAARIDSAFANSPAETKTATERAVIQAVADQIGDIKTIVVAVASAIFLTLLLVSGNTMAQSVAERTRELATLKTLGYSNSLVLSLVFSETFALTALGGFIGLALSALAAGKMSALRQYFPVVGVPQSTYVIGAILVVALSVLTALAPSLHISRLKIADALRKG
jgi:putative ABC transport system permease protein